MLTNITSGNTKGGYDCTIYLLFDWFGISCDNWHFLFLFAKQTKSKPVKQEVNGTVILPPLLFLIKTSLLRLAKGKCSSLFRPLCQSPRKMFYNIENRRLFWQRSLRSLLLNPSIHSGEIQFFHWLTGISGNPYWKGQLGNPCRQDSFLFKVDKCQ